jgi:hypothetical protein
MKLICLIKPNDEGFVLAHFGRKEYYFQPDADGDLVCDVDDDDHISQLIESGNFCPYDEADFHTALNGVIGGEDNDDDAEDQSNPDTAPLEALTPSKPREPRKPKVE